MNLLTEKWCNLGTNAIVVIITDEEQLAVAKVIESDSVHNCEILVYDDLERIMDRLQSLNPWDLVIVSLSFNTYVQKGANRYFSPFCKPQGVLAKYAFIRLGITSDSLLQGLSTPKELVYEKINELGVYKHGCKLHVTNSVGTDIMLDINEFVAYDNEICVDGGMAFLPPSEISAEVISGTANGKIVVDVTVGQLYFYGEFLGYFGLVDESVVTLTIENGIVVNITGGKMGTELKEKLFALSIECRELVELGHGLSKITPTGLIGVDESIIDTCHFGIGDGGKCGVHLDVVIGIPNIVSVK